MFSLSVSAVQPTVPAQHAAISYGNFGVSLSSVVLIFIIIIICFCWLFYLLDSPLQNQLAALKKKAKSNNLSHGLLIGGLTLSHTHTHTHAHRVALRALSRNNRSCPCVNKTQTTRTHTHAYRDGVPRYTCFARAAKRGTKERAKLKKWPSSSWMSWVLIQKGEKGKLTSNW